MQKITPFFWYTKNAEEAAAFYAGIFPVSKVERVTAMPSDFAERPRPARSRWSTSCCAGRPSPR